jgi:FKBP-type peptidyl-prolyl cis-trans isomerase
MNMVNNQEKSGTYGGIRIIIIFLMLSFIGLSCASQRRVRTPKTPVFKTHESGIQYRIKETTRGDLVRENDLVWVHYILMLEDSTVVDNSYERGEPVYFKMGAGQVILGWETGISLLRKGEKATLVIPPDLAYGNRSLGAIPANSTLYFDVEIVDIKPAPKPFALDKDAEIITTTSGLKYTIVKPGKGMMLIPGMNVQIHYTGFFEDMNQFDSSHDRNEPLEFTLGRGLVIKGWEEGISKLRVGDKARLWVPYQLAYGETGRGPIPPAANLIFDVEVLHAEEIKRPAPYPVSGKDTITTESGLQYMVVKKGNGDFPAHGQMVMVDYTGFLLNGNIFDSSVERGQPFRFMLGRNQVIPGWDEGIALMDVGARYRFIIPSDLAYGERAIGPIPANATLIFDVELLEIK